MEFLLLYQERAEIGDLENESKHLIARARAGDDAAFGVIFEQHSRFVYKFIYAMLGEAGTAEELKQETFLAAYKSLYALRDEAHLRTWLCGIAKNLVYKTLRARRKEGINSGAELASLEIEDEKNPLPDKDFLNRELSRAIGAALARLDEDKRVVFVLRELQHLSYAEISEVTGSAIAKLKTDLRRAKIEMRRVLRPYLETKL
jgi:RNA polymerase sigma-70 factor (ECF subfamily)